MGHRRWLAGLAAGGVAGMAALAWWAWNPEPALAPGHLQTLQSAQPGPQIAAASPPSMGTPAGAQSASAASLQADALITPGAGAMPSAAPRSSVPATGASSPASGPASSRLADRLKSGRDIGSEGYGPYIREALEATDPAMAMLALHRIAVCPLNAEIQAGHERLKSDPRLPPKLLAEMIEHYRADERRCQTLTPEIAALRPQLALKAMRGGAIGGAAAYARAVNFQPSDELRPVLLAALQRDAQAGDRDALMTLAMPRMIQGLPAFDQRVYVLALRSLEADSSMRELFEWVQRFGPNSDLPAADEARAQAAARALVEKIRAAEPKRP